MNRLHPTFSKGGAARSEEDGNIEATQDTGRYVHLWIDGNVMVCEKQEAIRLAACIANLFADDPDDCEGCGVEATTRSSDGVPLCAECMAATIADNKNAAAWEESFQDMGATNGDDL